MAKPTGGKNGAPKKKTHLNQELLDDLNELEYSGHNNDIWYDIHNIFTARNASPSLIALIESRMDETVDIDVYEVKNIIDDMILEVINAKNISTQKSIIDDVKIKLSSMRCPSLINNERSNMISRVIGQLNGIVFQDILLTRKDIDYLYSVPNKITPGEIEFILKHIDLLIHEALAPNPKRKARLHKPLQEWDKFEEIEWGDSGVALVKHAISKEDFKYMLYEVAFNIRSTEGVPSSVIDSLIYTTPPEKRKPSDKIYDKTEPVNVKRSFITKIFQNKLKDYYKSLFASEEEYKELMEKQKESKKLKHDSHLESNSLKTYSPNELEEYKKEHKKEIDAYMECYKKCKKQQAS